MLYALAHPASLAVLLLSLVVGLSLHGWVQAAVATRLGDPRPRQSGRLTPDPRRQVDPFGAVAALIGGLGWTLPVDLPTRTSSRTLHRAGPGRVVTVALVGPATNLLLGVGLLLTWRFLDGPGDPLAGGAASLLQHGTPLSGLGDVLLLAGASQLYLGALSLVPLPPLDGGRLLFALAPRTHGWLRAEHHLVERNIGVAVLLALLLIPLGGPVPVLPSVLDALLSPLLRLLCGG